MCTHLSYESPQGGYHSLQQREIAQVKLDINSVSSGEQTTQNLLPAEHLRNDTANNLRLTGLEGTNDEIKSKFIRLAAEKMNINIQINEMAVRMPLPPITQDKQANSFHSYIYQYLDKKADF